MSYLYNPQNPYTRNPLVRSSSLPQYNTYNRYPSTMNLYYRPQLARQGQPYYNYYPKYSNMSVMVESPYDYRLEELYRKRSLENNLLKDIELQNKRKREELNMLLENQKMIQGLNNNNSGNNLGPTNNIMIENNLLRQQNSELLKKYIDKSNEESKIPPPIITVPLPPPEPRVSTPRPELAKNQSGQYLPNIMAMQSPFIGLNPNVYVDTRTMMNNTAAPAKDKSKKKKGKKGKGKKSKGKKKKK